jgi:hypothetical protein
MVALISWVSSTSWVSPTSSVSSVVPEPLDTRAVSGALAFVDLVT